MTEIILPTDSEACKAAIAAVNILKAHGYKGYFIGGSVRDLLLKTIPKDYDIATNATPEQIHAIPDFSKAFYKDLAQAYGVSRVHLPEWPTIELEIATFRQDIDPHLGRKATKVMYTSLEADAIRRDFTINALAYDPISKKLVDYADGRSDLATQTIRFIGDPLARTSEDPLRILRAIRFKNSLHFHYAPETTLAIRAAIAQGDIEKIATDRLRQELTRILQHTSRMQALLDLDEFLILDKILPEVTRGKGIPQPPDIHAEGDVWRHTLLAMEALPAQPSERLVWATLLHDIGKPPTLTHPIGANDRIRFSRHYAVGAEMALGLLRRFNFSKKMTADICWMIEHHINIDDVPHMRAGHQRAMLDHPAFEDLLALHRADAMATWPPSGPHTKPVVFPELDALWHQHRTITSKSPRPNLKRDIGIDGHWLRQMFPDQLEQLDSAHIGKILDKLNNAYENEGMTQKQEIHQCAHQLIVDAIAEKITQANQ